MGLETATYIADLNKDFPDGEADQFATAADHIRLIKTVLINSFPNLDATVTSSDQDLSLLETLAATPTQLTPYPQNTQSLFLTAAAPTGWTQVTSVNDKVFSCVDGTHATGGITGGSWTISGFTITETQLGIEHIPPHSHDVLYGGANFPVAKQEAAGIGGQSNSDDGGGSNVTNRAEITVDLNDNGISNPLKIWGASNPHNHSGAAGDGTWRPKYVDTIICSKDLV